MITIYDFEQGSPEWHKIRDPLYTGSNAEKFLLNDDKFKIIDGVKTNYALAGTSNFKGNFYTRRGHTLEDQAIELYEKIYSVKIDRPGFVTNTKYPRCGYSPDGLMADRTGEVKAFNMTKHRKMYNGDIPLKVIAQCYFGMVICGKKICDLIIYNPDFAKKEIEGKTNPDYDPKLAFKVITIKLTRPIFTNFNRKLSAAL